MSISVRSWMPFSCIFGRAFRSSTCHRFSDLRKCDLRCDEAPICEWRLGRSGSGASQDLPRARSDFQKIRNVLNGAGQALARVAGQASARNTVLLPLPANTSRATRFGSLSCKELLPEEALQFGATEEQIPRRTFLHGLLYWLNEEVAVARSPVDVRSGSTFRGSARSSRNPAVPRENCRHSTRYVALTAQRSKSVEAPALPRRRVAGVDRASSSPEQGPKFNATALPR